MRQWLIKLGVPTLAITLGFGMISHLNFWFGIGLATLGGASLALDAWRRTVGKTLMLRVGITCLPLVGYAAMLPFVFIVAPLDVLMLTFPAGTYVEGADINGITWKSSFAPLKIAVRNETSLDYTNVDMYVRTNLAIDQIGLASGVSRCVATATIAGATISNFYRVQCDKIAPSSRIDIALALVGRDTSHQLDSRTSPAWAALSAEYDAANRRRTRFFSRCFLISCGSYLPPSLDDVLR